MRNIYWFFLAFLALFGLLRNGEQGSLVRTRQLGIGVAEVRGHGFLGVELGGRGNPFRLPIGIVLGKDRDQPTAQMRGKKSVLFGLPMVALPMVY